MLNRRTATTVLMATTAVFFAGQSVAQDWPSGPIRLLVPWAAGGGTEPVARLLAEGLSERLGQPLVIDFQPGAGGTIGTNAFMGTAPDGQTLMITSQAPVVNALFTTPDLAYDPRELVAITQVTDSPTVVVANAALPVEDLRELIEYATANPGEINAAISGIGTVTHFAVSMLHHHTDAEFNIVPYSGAGAQLNDLMSGAVDIGFGFPAGFMGGVEGGLLKFLGTLGAERMDVVPDIPTSVELGYPDILVGGWFMVFGPPGLPDEIANRVAAATNDFLTTDAARERLEALGYIVIDDSTPEIAQAQIERDREAFRAVWESGAMVMEFN